MLGKLISYEFKTTRKTFGLVYLVLIICSLLTGLMSGNSIHSEIISSLTFIIIEAFVIAAIVILIRVVIKVYSDELYSSQAYLNRTLPVKTWQLLLAKLIVIMIWVLLTMICVTVCLFVYVNMMVISLGNGADVLEAMQEIFRLIASFLEQYWPLVLEMFLVLATEILLIGLVITITACFHMNKGKSFVSVLLFFLIGLLSNWIFYDLILGDYDLGMFFESSMSYSINTLTSCLISIGLGTIYFLVTAYLLKKKADLI